MPSRRYYIATAPVAHINGKMAPQWQKCPNTDDSEHVVVDGFWYGYKRNQVSRFGVRQRCRDLNTRPYTPAEFENRTLFTSSLLAVYKHKTAPADWALMLIDFDRQDRYTSPIGFAVSVCRMRGGDWPPEWVA